VFWQNTSEKIKQKGKEVAYGYYTTKTSIQLERK